MNCKKNAKSRSDDEHRLFDPAVEKVVDYLINRLSTSMENIILLYGMHRIMPHPGRFGLNLICLIRQNG